MENPPVQCKALKVFDLDGTLVRTKSGKTHPGHHADWAPFHDTMVKQKLRELHASGTCRIVIITNQRGVSSRYVSASDIHHRIDACLKYYDVPAVVLMATHDDLFRKPRPSRVSHN